MKKEKIKEENLLINKFVPKREGKIHIDYTKHNLEPSKKSHGEYLEYYCHRCAYDFECQETIRCCGECPMLKQSYIDILKVLDDETKSILKKKVEDAGLFTENEHCKTCKGKKCKNNPNARYDAVNYINLSFFECFSNR